MRMLNTLVGLTTLGAVLTGILGLIFGIVAYLSGDAIGGGICLIAAAVAFGFSMRAVLTT